MYFYLGLTHIECSYILSEEWTNSRLVANFIRLKPAQGARALGHHILINQKDQNIDNLLFEAACVSPLISKEDRYLVDESNSELYNIQQQYKDNPVADRIAQLLVDKPLLFKGIKFDLRIFVFVRSFVPFEGNFFIEFFQTS